MTPPMQGFRSGDRLARSIPADPVPGEPIATFPIMFLHIPRTAGFTLKTILESTFGRQRSLLDAHFYDPSADDLAGLAVIEGHVRTVYFSRRLGPEWYRNGMTMVREPVARAVSHVRHARAQRDDPRHHLVADEVRDPDELFRRMPLWFNLQTKLLASRPAYAETLDDTALDDAKAMLDRLAFGLTEDFETSAALFVERFTFDLPPLGRMNASAASGDEDLLSEEFRAAARAHNLIDAELYEHARELFARRVDDYVKVLVESPLDEGPLEVDLQAKGTGHVDETLRVPAAATRVELMGWVLVDGCPPDAVLVRAGTRTMPLCSRVFCPEAAKPTRDPSRRSAGVVGTVAVPPDVDSLELIALDRAHGRRAQRTLAVVREGSEDEGGEPRKRGLRARARQALRGGA